MEKTVLISLPVEDLQTLIIDCVNSCLKHHHPDERMMQDNSPDLLTIKQCAAYLNYSVPTIYTKISRKELPTLKIQNSNRVWFSKKDLNDLIRKGRRKTKAEIEQAANNYVSLKK